MKHLRQAVFKYYDKRNELGYYHGLLLWNDRSIIPQSLQRALMHILREGQAGFVSYRIIAVLKCNSIAGANVL